MVDVRCPDFNEDLWNYVAEYARKKKKSRCAALEDIVLEHMKFLAKEQISRTRPT
jgi:hypothetical protein